MRAVLTIISACDDLTANAGKFIDASADRIDWEHIFKQRWSNEQKTVLAWAFALWRDEARPRFDVFESSSAMGESLKLAVLRAIMIRWHFGTKRTDELFTDENQSGAKSSRPALDRMMSLVAAGEVEKVISYSLSRLGRSTTHRLNLMDEMARKDTKFVSLSERLETETPAGRMIFTVLAAVSQLERELIVERVKNGLANARAKGKQIGRKKVRDSLLIRSLLKTGMSFRQISVIAKCSHGSVSAEKAALRKEEEAAKLASQAQSDTGAAIENQVELEISKLNDEPKIVFVELGSSPSELKRSSKIARAA